MPLFEFRCKKCHAVTEVLCQGAGSENRAVNCAGCGSLATSKVISKVSFKVAKPAKYSEAFLHKARPFLRAQKETAQYFAECPRSRAELARPELSSRLRFGKLQISLHF